jgi:hypothetical protein
MGWNSIAMAQKFLSRANAIHPEEEDDADAQVSKQAEQDLYYECYMMSFEKSKLVEFLEKAALGTFKIPKDVDKDLYRNAFIQQAGNVLRGLEKE